MSVRSVDNASASRYVPWLSGTGLTRVFISVEIVNDMQPLLAARGEGRPNESGGVLFGRAEQTDKGWSVWVDGFALFECEHVRGASWTLSARDRRAFARAMQKWRSRGVVGWFRTHTRPGLFLDQHDFALFSEFFPQPAAVALAVRPDAQGTPQAGFFVWEDGDMRRTSPHQTFPFSAPVQPSVSAPVPKPQHAAAQFKPTPAKARGGRSHVTVARRNWRKGLLLAPVAAGLAAGMLWNPEVTPKPRRVVRAESQPAASNPEPERTVFAPVEHAEVLPPATAPEWRLPAAGTPVATANPVAGESVVAPAPVFRKAVETRSRTAEPARRRLVAPAARKTRLPQPQVALAPPELKLAASGPAGVFAHHKPSVPAIEAPEASSKRPSVIRRAVGSIPGLGFLKRKKNQTPDN